MISSVVGKVLRKHNDWLIVSTNSGVGYKIYVSQKTMMRIGAEETQYYTHTQLRQDDISLYGFLSFEELVTFETLITVSGIGAKVALAILDQFTPSEVVIAILSADVATLTKTKGLGKKTAERLILELRDKIAEMNKNTDGLVASNSGEAHSDKNSAFLNLDDVEDADKKNVEAVFVDAIDALIALGFNKIEAKKAVATVFNKDMTTEDAIKASLKIIGSF